MTRRDEPARPACLALQDGARFDGFVVGAALPVAGEVVFNTAMTGYQEMLTDPSYRGQILVLTTPHVGNVGVNADDAESAGVWARALIVPDLHDVPSSWRSERSLVALALEAGVPVAFGFDTRALVLHLRAHGALPGVLAEAGALAEGELLARARGARGTDGCDLTVEVACSAPYTWTNGPWSRTAVTPAAARPQDASVFAGVGPRNPDPGPRVVVIDCGVKRSILRQLAGAGADVMVVPPATAAAEIVGLGAAGVVVSNGPGDPAAVAVVPAAVRELLGRLPLLGICLGHQLLAIALGARTYKLPFGHHGGNHPVRDLASGAVWITSQNHNYAVDASTLPAAAAVTMVNLTDGSVEGLRVEGAGAEGIQFHPEAGPGPHDALGVLARFVDRCRQSRGEERGERGE